MAQLSISEDILELTDSGPRLKGAKCADCGNYVFPAASGCSRCAGDKMESAVLDTRGELWAWTVQGFPPKSPPYFGETDPQKFEPYGVGYITLPGQLKVEARLTESDPKKLAEGMPMVLTTVVLKQNEDGDEIVTYAFAPDSEQENKQ